MHPLLRACPILLLLPATAGAGGAASAAGPALTPPLRWSKTQGVAWSIPLPGPGAGTPLVVGDRVFVPAEPCRLLCIRKADGHVLWDRAHEPEAILPPSAQDEYRARARQWYDLSIRRFAAELEKTRADRALLDSPTNAEARARSARAKTEFHQLEQERQGYPRFHRASVRGAAGGAACTPVSDGAAVFALFGNGVGARYDLDGNLTWARFFSPVTVAEGQTMSPALADGTLGVHYDHEFFGLDWAGGRTRWVKPHRRDGNARWPGTPSGSPAALRVDGTPLLLSTAGPAWTAPDGRLAAKGPALLQQGYAVRGDTAWFVGEDDHLVASRFARGADGAFDRRDALRVPLREAGDKAQLVFAAAPLVHDGCAYVLERGGTLFVVELATRGVVFRRQLGIGEAAGAPAAAGRFLFAAGSQGACVVIEKRLRREQVQPGKTAIVPAFAEFARNTLEPGRCGVVLDGDCLYHRGATRLYCVRASDEDRAAARPVDENLEELLLKDPDRPAAEP